MNPSVDPLSHTLGRIEQSLETITKTLSEDRTSAAQYRTDVRRDLTAVRDNVIDLKNRVNNNADELAEMRPIVQDYGLRRDKGLGMADLTKTVWTVLVGLSSMGVGFIIHAFWPTPK